MVSGGNGGGRSQRPTEQGSDPEEIAKTLLEGVGEESLKELLERYGYEKAARRLARFGSYYSVYEALVAIKKCFSATMRCDIETVVATLRPRPTGA